MKRTRYFNGKPYRWDNLERFRKADAKEAAEEARDQGYLARVLRTGDGWGVYLHDPPDREPRGDLLDVGPCGACGLDVADVEETQAPESPTGLLCPGCTPDEIPEDPEGDHPPPTYGNRVI